MVVYFSGTGNSRLCARVIAKALDDSVLDSFSYIRNRREASLYSEKPWVFVAPIHAWLLPAAFAEFLEESRFTGCRDAYFVITCGSEIGAVDRGLRGLCEEMHLNYRGVMPIPMPNNYMLFSDLETPEEAEAIIAEARPKMAEAARLISVGSPFPRRKIGLVDAVKSAAIGPVFARFATDARPFYFTDGCIGCGKCEKLCPKGNIVMMDGKPHWEDRCMQCLACINACPEKAIEYGKKTVGKRRYYCTLEE